TAETRAPQRSAISISSSPKRPHSPTTTRSPGSTTDVMAASSAARPAPETGNARSFSVSNAKRVSAVTSFMMAVDSGSNWPSTGVDIARSTRGSAIEGPGPSRMRGPGRSSRTPRPYPKQRFACQPEKNGRQCDTLTTAQMNGMDRTAFIRTFGGVFENSPWVAEQAWTARPFADVAALHATMCDAVRKAPRARQLELLRAHPDLAGRTARAGAMSA